MKGDEEKVKAALDEFDKVLEETERLAKELEEINHPEKKDGEQTSQSSN